MRLNHPRPFLAVCKLWVALLAATSVALFALPAGGGFDVGHWHVDGLFVTLAIFAIACVPAAIAAWRLPERLSSANGARATWLVWTGVVVACLLFAIRDPLRPPSVAHVDTWSTERGSSISTWTEYSIDASPRLRDVNGTHWLYGHYQGWSLTEDQPAGVWSCREQPQRCALFECHEREVAWLASFLYLRHTEIPEVTSARQRAHLRCHPLDRRTLDRHRYLDGSRYAVGSG